MFTLFLPFIVNYYQELGFSLTKIAILLSSAKIIVFMMEIPSGYFADRYGRKTSLVIGVLFQLISLSILYLYKDFTMLIISHIFLGLCTSFLSGSFSALLYDSLLVLNKENEYKKIRGRAKSCAEFAVIVSAILGSVVIKYGISYTFLFTIFTYLILLALSFSLTEPNKHKKIEKYPLNVELKLLFGIIKESLHNKKLLGLFLYSFVVMGAINLIFFIYQPYFQDVGIDVMYNGYIYAVLSLFAAISALTAHSIEKKLGVFNSLLFMPVLIALILVLSSVFYFWYAIFFFLVRELVRGFFFPVTGDYANKIIPSSKRATVLSIKSMFSRIGSMIIITSFGFFSDMHGMKHMLLVTGIFLFLFTAVIYVILKNKSKKKINTV